MAAAHKFPVPIPEAIRELLGSKLTANAVVRELEQKHGISVKRDAVAYHRRNLFPGSTWEGGRPEGVKDSKPRRASKNEEVLEAFTEVRRFNLEWIAAVNASRRLRNVLPINPYAPGDLW